jgi:hypothetical protein
VIERICVRIRSREERRGGQPGSSGPSGSVKQDDDAHAGEDEERWTSPVVGVPSVGGDPGIRG